MSSKHSTPAPEVVHSSIPTLIYSVLGPARHYPELPGLYVIWCNRGNGEPVHWEEPSYIGQTQNFRKRIVQHRYSKYRLFTDAAMVTFLPVASADIRRDMERWLIKKHKPCYNLTLKGGCA